MENMTEIVKDTGRIAADVLGMIRKINAHLFGVGSLCCEKEDDPKCFRDDLMKTKRDLLVAAEELAEICVMLGM
jgi:hypothetical protein